jgi:hypothetical protein
LIELKTRIDKVKNQLLNGVAFDSLLELLGQLETNKKATEERLERLRAEAEGRPADDLAEAQHIVDLVYQAPEGEREALRDRLRSRIRQLVSEIWILVGSESRYHRRATVQVFFKKGGFRFLQFENVGKGRNRGTTFMTNKDGCDPPAIDLRAWREKGPG